MPCKFNSLEEEREYKRKMIKKYRDRLPVRAYFQGIKDGLINKKAKNTKLSLNDQKRLDMVTKALVYIRKAKI